MSREDFERAEADRFLKWLGAALEERFNISFRLSAGETSHGSLNIFNIDLGAGGDERLKNAVLAGALVSSLVTTFANYDDAKVGFLHFANDVGSFVESAIHDYGAKHQMPVISGQYALLPERRYLGELEGGLFPLIIAEEQPPEQHLHVHNSLQLSDPKGACRWSLYDIASALNGRNIKADCGFWWANTDVRNVLVRIGATTP